MTSLSWSVVAKLVSQGATFLGTIVLARVLPASDFGLVAMSLVYLGLLQQFVDIGLLQALIQRPALTHEEVAASFWALLGAGAVGFGASVAAMDLLDATFRTPGVGAVIAVQSSILLLLPFRVIGQALLSREVRIDEVSKREVVIGVLRVAASIVLAWRGARVWSLVLPQVAAEAAFSLSCFRRSGWRPTRELSWVALRPLARYGVDMTLSRIAWFAASRADQFVVGRALGPSALGYYAVAWQFAGAFPQFLAATVSRVVFPVFARLQQDAAHLRRAFVDLLRYLLLAALPALAGIALVAPDLVAVALNASWLPAVRPLQVLCAVALFRTVEAMAGFVINARGRTRDNLWLNVLSFLFAAAGAVAGAATGRVAGVAVAMALASFPIALLFTRAAMRECGGRVREAAAGLVAPVTSTAWMCGCVAAAAAVLATRAPGVRLAATIPLGVVSYVVAVLLLARDAVAQLRTAA